MLHERTTIAAAARLIGETLRTQYAVDPAPVFVKAGIDATRLDVSGARYPWASMQRLWLEAAGACGDPCFGLSVGRNIRPTTFHALGFSWLASRTLLESLERLVRYTRLLTTAPVQLSLKESDGQWTLADRVMQRGIPGADDISVDAFLMAIVGLCRQASNKHFCPAEVHLRKASGEHADTYIRSFECPVYFGADVDSISFDKNALEAPLPGDNLELALVNDRIAEEYIEALDPSTVSTSVRKLLVELLPSGDANQQAIAKQMNRSLSTLQRQLAAEGTNYKDIREQTRRELAEQYVREGRYSLSQIAYLLGFSDQSNFSRAFRRWTGHSPGNYARAPRTGA
ncbi:MAG: AraC family transcriptional regulator [Gammaproteobacteria bacterium]|jgi:AraC-like DNA-binding protein